MEQTVSSPDKKKISRLKKTLIFLALVFLVLIIALAYYMLTQKPIIDVVTQSKTAPRFVMSIPIPEGKHLAGIAVSRNGSRVYVVDSEAQKVWIISKEGKVLGSFGAQATAENPDGFMAPLFAGVDSKDRIYVTDRQGYRVLIFSPVGKFINYFVPEPGENFVWSPLAIKIISNKIYLTDAKKQQHRVLIFNEDGKLTKQFGEQGSGKGQLSFPSGIAVNKEGRIFVSDSNNARVQAFDSSGKFLLTLKPGTGVDLSHPSGIDASRDNEVLVVDSFGHEVQAYDYDGNYLYKFGKMGIGDGQFLYPQGIAVAGDGRVYVVDRQNNRVQVWQF